jgi:hypothetical protein
MARCVGFALVLSFSASGGSADGAPDPGRARGYRRISRVCFIRLGTPAMPRLRRLLRAGNELCQKQR